MGFSMRPGSRSKAAAPRSGRRQGSLLRSFSHAFEGLVHSVRYQRNMRIHLCVALLMIIACIFIQLTRTELVIVVVTISLVFITEMLNTALEAVVDIITDEFDPRAKIAKDVAAGAVLVAAVNALVVAYLIFVDKVHGLSLEIVTTIRNSSTHLTFVVLAVVVILVIAIKALSGRRSLLSGGMPSGHAALAFAGWTVITLVTAAASYGMLVCGVAFIMAALVSQSRVEAGIHSMLEVVVGAILGIVVAMLVFQLWL